MKTLVSIGPPDVNPVVLEVESIVDRTNVRGDVRESMQFLACRGKDTFGTLTGIAEPEKRKACVEVGKRELAAARRQRTKWEHRLGQVTNHVVPY